MLNEYFHILLFTLIGFFFMTVLLGVSALLRARESSKKDSSPYECGMEAFGTPWVSPNIRFYVFALLFVIFDVETLFLFPWAVQFQALGVYGFTAVILFVGILFIGLIFVWRKGALQWE